MDIVVHSIAFAPREQLEGLYLDAVSREGFLMAHDISSYSFSALARGFAPLLKERNGALLTLTYIGAMRSMPGYNVMGLAKASLEANVRYCAQSCGSRWNPSQCNFSRSDPHLGSFRNSRYENHDGLLRKDFPRSVAVLRSRKLAMRQPFFVLTLPLE